MHFLAPIFASFLLIGCTDGVPVPKRISNILQKADSEFKPASYASNMAVGGSCNFDEIADVAPNAEVIEINRSQQVKYVGWAALSPDKGIIGGNVTLLLTNSSGKMFDAPAQRQDREDVAKYFNKSELLGAGFVAYISATAVPPGSYSLSIVQNNKGIQACPVRKQVVIK